MSTPSRQFIRWMAAAWGAVSFMGAGLRVLADCSSFGLPFTDLGSETTFCAAIAEAYYTGITLGTSATTFSPNEDVTRAEAAAFATRTLDVGLTRGSRRAALGQWWTSTPHFDLGLGVTRVGNAPFFPQSDGTDIWVPNSEDGTVTRVRASDGKPLGTWTGATAAFDVVIAMGKIFVTGVTSSGSLYMIDPTGSPGAVTLISNSLGTNSSMYLAFDGQSVWTVAQGNGAGTISIISPSGPGTWNVNSISVSYQPIGIVYDGNNIWVCAVDGVSDSSIKKLDSSGAVLQKVSLPGPVVGVFDGTNLWMLNPGVPSVSVVRASTGTVVATLGPDGMLDPGGIAFDGERILVTNFVNGNVSLFHATSLSYLGSFPTGYSGSAGACSDGVNFWITELNGNTIGRF